MKDRWYPKALFPTKKRYPLGADGGTFVDIRLRRFSSGENVRAVYGFCIKEAGVWKLLGMGEDIDQLRALALRYLRKEDLAPATAP